LRFVHGRSSIAATHHNVSSAAERSRRRWSLAPVTTSTTAAAATPPSRRARQQAQQAQQALTAAERALDHAFAACARRDEDAWPPARPATGLAAVEIIWRLAAQFCDARALWLTSV